MKSVLSKLIICAEVFVAACTLSSANLGQNEIVLSERMSISATNDIGTIRIKAGSGFLRYFTWANDTRFVNMWPRKERWHGSYGLYYPGPGSHWKEHDGITRAVVDEGVLHYNSLDELILDLQKYSDKGKLVYSDDGLCVYWDKNPGAGGTLTVLLWQLLINGEKPTKIPGSQNDRIKVSYD